MSAQSWWAAPLRAEPPHRGARARRAPRLLAATAVATLLGSLIPAFGAPAAVVAAPTSVTIAGSLQSEMGCTGDWQPDCAATHLAYDASDDVWQGSWAIPAGTYEYKAALDDSWAVNYGINASPDGANIPLALAAPASVKFYYDDKTHWVTDNHSSVIATVVGSFQSELGCPGDWQPDCLRSWLEDPSGSGTDSFVTTALPAGMYEAKVAIDEGWTENYGQGGAPGGANIPFTVPANNAKVTFTYDPATHVLTILAGHAHDNNVEWDGLRHDSRDPLYRTPGGAVTAATPVTLRFRTFHDDVTSVKARIWDVDTGSQQVLPMSIAAAGVPCYQTGLETESCDFWSVTLADAAPDNLWYRFIVADGTSTAYYADDTAALDGGLGAPSADVLDNSWALMVYDPAFTTPDWAKSAVVYQIFPDRFRNGRANNDPKTGDVRYDTPVLRLPWNTKPEGYCRDYAGATAATCPWRFGEPAGQTSVIEQPLGRDYMGGDLKGIDQNLAYLTSLGVNTLYLNPIFDSASNHGYDTRDYYQVNPYFGTQKDWENLVKHAGQLGVRIILDGVFNHVSSDSPYFDRYGHYATLGACESTSSPYRAWFTFHEVPAGTGTCAGAAGPKSATYDAWFGFDSLPVLDKTNPQVQSYFLTNADSVTRHWLVGGASGWRLDVMGDVSFPSGYWETFRSVVKGTNPDALIIGELWQKDSTLLRFLRGDRADTAMDYRFRDAVLGFLAPQTFDSKGFPDSGYQISPTQFANRLSSIREDYPDPAYYTLMNLLDSHDTERLLWTLTPGAMTAADRELNAANLAAGKQRVKLASLIQFTMPGAPTVYYGDEVGVTGATDPDDRRTYPWTDLGGQPDTNLLAHYRALGTLRGQLPVLSQGDFRVLLADDAAGTVAYGRKTGTQAAIVAVNRTQSARTLHVPVAGYVPDGVAFTPRLGTGTVPAAAISTSGGTLTIELGAMSGVVLATGSVDLTPPAAPALTVTNTGNASVTLTWTAPASAVAYDVYRSPLTGGGYVRLNGAPLTAATYTDTTATNGQTWYYVVGAIDAAGNVGEASNEVSATPHLTIGWANLQWPPTITHVISAVTRTPNVYGQVWIDGATNLPGQTPTLRAQLGYGPTGTNPATGAGWTWIEATFNLDAGNNDEFVASMLPDTVGAYDYVYRYTTTNGASWFYADLNGPIPTSTLPPNPGHLTVDASDDATAPSVPAGLAVTDASPDAISLAWDANAGDPTMYGYEVGRSSSAVGPYTVLGLTTGTTYTDASVASGATYHYAVRAVDQSFNRSDWSDSLEAVAQLRTVTVTFNVTVPASTDGTGRSVYIAGNLSVLNGGLPDWNPGATVMTRTDATHWTITLTGTENVALQYKYALGDWDHVEKDAACGEIGNRTLTLTYGTTGTQQVNDTVLNWRNVSPCGN